MRLDSEVTQSVKADAIRLDTTVRTASTRLDATVKTASTRVDATVKEALPNALFKLELKTGQTVHAHLAEELRLHVLRILPGDQVTLEISPYDLGRGRILRRKGP